MCLDPIAVATEDLGDLGSPKQADSAARRPRCFGEQLDQQLGGARDGHRCASVAKSEIQTPRDRTATGTADPAVPLPPPTALSLGQRCPKLLAESGRYRVLGIDSPAGSPAFSLQIG